MTKPIGATCNLDCSYCFYREKEKLYPGKQGSRMDGPVLESFIRQYIQSQKTDEIDFTWQGGEPTLLGVDYFRKVVKLQEVYSEGRIINNSIQTNGTLLNDEWAEFLSTHNFLVGISIDGPGEIHDQYRINKTGQGSFDNALKGLNVLKSHAVEFSIVTSIHRMNAGKPIQLYNFLKELGCPFLQFIPIVERKSHACTEDTLRLVSPDYNEDATITEWSIDPLQYGHFMAEMFDEWIQRDVGTVFIHLFDICLEAWTGHQPGLCIFRETCGNAMAIEQNGDLYSCDHYVYPANKLGNIMADPLNLLVNSDQQIRFGMDKKATLPEQCIKCEFRFVCNGGCPKHRFVITAEGQHRLNYLCPGYKHFFRHVDPYVTFMARELLNGRAPSNVMNWAKEQGSVARKEC